MRPYNNKSGDSGVIAYKLDSHSITVRFRDGDSYVYSYESAGKKAVEEMKKLAISGAGLATYINKYVKNAYERKIG
jgi:hypothetical protein